MSGRSTTLSIEVWFCIIIPLKKRPHRWPKGELRAGNERVGRRSCSIAAREESGVIAVNLGDGSGSNHSLRAIFCVPDKTAARMVAPTRDYASINAKASPRPTLQSTSLASTCVCRQRLCGLRVLCYLLRNT